MVTMARMVKSFRLDETEELFLRKLAEKYNVSEAEVLRKILELFIKDAVKQERLDEELKTIALKKIEQQTLKEIREEGKTLQRKATFRVRMRKFYTKLIEDGVRWDELKPTFISWFNEAKFLGIDEKVVKETIEEIAHIYYQVHNDIDMEKGLEEVYQLFLEELEGVE